MIGPKKSTRNSHKITHGKTRTPEHKIWVEMRQRCNNPNSQSYDRYGGRGIKVCSAWEDSFQAFIADMGARSAGQSLDRIDNDKGYGPGNCRWASRTEQQRNTSRNIMLSYNGVTQCVSAWAKQLNYTDKLIWNRLNNLNWSVEKALSTPPRKHKEYNVRS